MKTKLTLFHIGLICVLMTVSSISADCQIRQGTISVGPTLDFSSSKQKFTDFGLELKTTSLEFGIRSDYFVIDNLAIGLWLGINSSNTDIEGQDTRTNGFSIGPQIDYYIGLSDEFYFSIGGGLAYNSIKEDDDFSGEVSLSGIGFGLRGGLHFLVNDKLGAFFAIGPDFGNLVEKETEIEVAWNEFESQIGVKFFFN